MIIGTYTASETDLHGPRRVPGLEHQAVADRASAGRNGRAVVGLLCLVGALSGVGLAAFGWGGVALASVAFLLGWGAASVAAGALS